MAGLWSENPATVGGKYLVTRRDGTIPSWPWFVLGARDPAAWKTLIEYANFCEKAGKDPEYVAGLRRKAAEFHEYLIEHGEGDPDAPRHRVDDPETVAKMAKAKGS